ncbi:MAG TPA: hypothetical protein VMR92_08480 [Gemmatimonadales bacterium]|nr:hypothetical protein [Gemmatimonadales bacterium]
MQTLYGQTRDQWALQAAKSLVASMDKQLLVHVVRLGFRRFEPLARREFSREEPRIVFTKDELRLMFQYLRETIPWRVV